jgi:bifunctional phosphoserine phosphatase/homoserine phosphotransferase
VAGVPALAATTRDIADYDVLMQRRIELCREHGLTLFRLREIVATMEPLPGALEFLAWARRWSLVVLVSDTFHELAGPVVEKLGSPLMLCNRLKLDSHGLIAGYELREQSGKAGAVAHLRQPGLRVLAIGDSFNDLAMLQAADGAFLIRPARGLMETGIAFPVASTYDELQNRVDEWFGKSQPSGGICYLAGAGPGDLGLVTLKTRECVERADVILYDYLCNSEILKWARPGTECIWVGKKSGTHACTQQEINTLLVEKTAAGKCVVRLKGGDPFLFGRGGEEAEVLAKAGLKFEIVPGVSSALAVPAYAGIPVTHRTCTSQVTIFTGHEDPLKPDSMLDLDQLARQPGTKVMLMGISRIAVISAELIKRGADPEMPVALVRWGTTERQEIVAGPLRDIARIVAEANFQPPAVAIFGEVVNLRDTLSWFNVPR